MSDTLIVFLGKYGDNTASAKRIRQLARGLREAGDQAAVIGYRRGAPVEAADAIRWTTDEWGVEHASVGVRGGSIRRPEVMRDALALPLQLAELVDRAVRERGFQRALLYGAGAFALRPALCRLRRARVPVVADLNEWHAWKRGSIRSALDQTLFRRFCLPELAGIVGISNYWEEYSQLRQKPVILIPPLSDGEFADLEEPIRGPFNLVYAGVLFRRDLPRTMIEGVRLALERGCDFRFIIVGRPSRFPEARQTLRQIAANPLLRERIHVTGWLEREPMREVFRNAGAFLLLRGGDLESRASSPTRLPEFLESGRPVITSRSVDVDTESRCVHRRNAWLLPEGHAPEELAGAICHLADNWDERVRIGRAGRELAGREYGYRRQGELLKRFLDGMGEGGGR